MYSLFITLYSQFLTSSSSKEFAFAFGIGSLSKWKLRDYQDKRKRTSSTIETEVFFFISKKTFWSNKNPNFKKIDLFLEEEEEEEMIKMTSSLSQKRRLDDPSLVDEVFSWSLEDVFNQQLFQHKVETIPMSFQSVDQYLQSYIYPLLEETRADLCSSMEAISKAPFAELTSLKESKPYGSLLYDVEVDSWRNRSATGGKESYKPKPGDIFILSDAAPDDSSEFNRYGRAWTYASVTRVSNNDDTLEGSKDFYDNDTCMNLKIKTSQSVEMKDGMRNSLFVVFLINLTTNNRVWISLNKLGNTKMLEDVLCPDSLVEKSRDLVSSLHTIDMHPRQFGARLDSLNESQAAAVHSCISSLQSTTDSPVRLIWGPPGTGKTKTVSTLLYNLLKMKCRTLACAPTNVAITELAARVLKLVRETCGLDTGISSTDCSLGNLLLFGNNERLKVNNDLEEIFLDYRVNRLRECFVPLTGWRHCITSMIDFLEHCVTQYHIFLENESSKEEEARIFISFLAFARERYQATSSPLKRCLRIMITHMSVDILLQHNQQSIARVLDLVDYFGSLLLQTDVVEKQLKDVFEQKTEKRTSRFEINIGSSSVCLYNTRCDCFFALKSLEKPLSDLDLPTSMNKYDIQDFCFQSASLIFCTASSSFKLHKAVMQPLDLVIIDEAAQLKECESTIPLQISGIRHAFLIGDELQLPAMVKSKVAAASGFGRSLFERLGSSGCPKHLLNVQYRMNPEISRFPNSMFYQNKILDAENVLVQSYERHYLQGPMFGPFSFINVLNGKEEVEDGSHSIKNMVEVAVLITIVRRLFKAWEVSKEKVSIGIVSPYAAQVAAIQVKLGKMYENVENFNVRVNTVDGFQGGEEDIIIISTVRSNTGGAIGFFSNPQRANVALTRAKHCLWIVGNGTTLVNSDSVWAALVKDAKDRRCFFYANEDKGLENTIIQVKKDLDQLEDLLHGESILFKSARWKVLFSDIFRKSFGNLKSAGLQKSVINLLLKLSSGWRPKNRNVDCAYENSLQLIQQFKVEGLYVISTIDIAKESTFTQVFKIWDIIPLHEMPKLAKRLDNIFQMYTDDFVMRCKAKRIEGDLEVPMTWGASISITRYKSLTSNMATEDDPKSKSIARTYVENSKMSDSLLVMKFYSLSSGVVSHLLSSSDGRELDLPFEVTEHETEIIHFPRSTFVLGRSGTGKTTVLTMKLIQKEQQYYFSSNGLHAIENMPGSSKETALRQLFVTVSPKLCAAIKNHISNLMRFTCGSSFQGDCSAVDMHEIDDTTQFSDVPDSFIDVKSNAFPLVLTFQKFLMMFDRSMENSYFDRFQDVREFSLGRSGTSSSISLHVFIRAKEVNFERFNSLYWPHFNCNLTKRLDPSTVFTEIISHIKGGLKEGKVCDGKLHREDYVSLCEGRVSCLSRDRREDIYDIYVDYEKKKIENGHFDLADFVNDLHVRLRQGLYEGELIDFVYIDEVQDLTMRQIALFKYISRNINEGFVFSGDTAQTIARGIDFRFQDIKSLFYNEFLPESDYDKTKEKGDQPCVSEIFHLNQNFRTHAGVLNLSQSVVDLLYHYFPFSVDVLSPETSLIYGESPVLLESGNDENAIVTIFGNSGSTGGSMIGFGAEQVILVRDDCARKEISDYVGKQALVLTILECKGLEFQDVLLYNFFGTSPLKNQWRVVYEYMKDQQLLDSTLTRSFPCFNESRHNILCSELKQLYVAITRTRQRLWICDNMDEFSRPMFDYWKRLGLVQSRQLDDSLAQAMQVASSEEEWSSRGIKLFNESNFEMATLCFERAGDSYREKWARAAGLRASAERLQVSNSEHARAAFTQAAEIYESINKAELAAKCFIELKDFQKAGTIYLEKCGETKLLEAGDCFSLAGCWSRAAEVYSRGKHFLKCLSACTKGSLFDMGFNFIKHWKESASDANDVVTKGHKNLEEMKQEFLERCALHSFEQKDTKSMVKFVKEFHSMDSTRTFLRSCNCLSELLSLEKERGNYREAAGIAREKGDLLLESNMLAMGDNYKDASMLILSYVLGSSVWSTGSKGWPLKYFAKKEELLQKAKKYAMKVSKLFYESVSLEASLLAHQEAGLLDLGKSFCSSGELANSNAEFLSAWKILDSHHQLHPTKYDWRHEGALKSLKNMKVQIPSRTASAEYLIHFWRFWLDRVRNIIDYLVNLGSENECNYTIYGEFCMGYLGVQKQNSNRFSIFVNTDDAFWIKEINTRFIHKTGDFVYLESHQFSSFARVYWTSQVLYVGIRVLETFDSLYKFSVQNPNLKFHQGMLLLHIFEVSKHIMEFSDWKNHPWALKKLWNYRQLSEENVFNILFPIDWRLAMEENMVTLRGTKACKDLIKEVISKSVESSVLSHGKIGRTVMLLLVAGSLTDDVYGKITWRFSGNQPWMNFVGHFKDHIDSDRRCISLVEEFNSALLDTYNANWSAEHDYISPYCFVYLVERLLFFVSSFQKFFFTTKSSLIEALDFENRGNKAIVDSPVDVSLSSSNQCCDFIAEVVHDILLNRQDTFSWLGKSGNAAIQGYPSMVLRLIILFCLLCVNTGKYFDLLSILLGTHEIRSVLPGAFYEILRKRNNQNFRDILNKALKKIENPLIVVIPGTSPQPFIFPEALVMYMNQIQCREDLVNILFPKSLEACNEDTSKLETEISSMSVTSEKMAADQISEHDLASKGIKTSHSHSTKGAADNVTVDQDLSGKEIQSSENQKKGEALDLSEVYSRFWSINDSFSSGSRDNDNAANIKLDIDSCICILESSVSKLDENLTLDVLYVLEGMKMLSLGVMNGSDPGVDSFEDVELRKIAVEEIFHNLKAIRPMLQPSLDAIFMHKDVKATDQDLQIAENNSNKGNEKNKGKGKSKAKRNKKKGKGKK